ncbi:asparaginyl-tRNA synthetase [Epithele typhae]|uniref:asparaginyl-tRNA synthetase n=1 Tax=Epithele typhae TaxID=378194 RepID=UPI0020080C87|nr:asparaginyl-tRNA synthetase [Epithele typhae]KAH9946149.1 asparaginyl-tRNA synthetase [Epithele typhae]
MLARRLFSSASLPPTIRQLLASPPPPHAAVVEVNGWIKSIRRQKKVAFAVISDGSSDSGLQAVFSNTDLAKLLSNGASVRLRGVLTNSIGAGQAKELKVEAAEVFGDCDPEEYPLQKQAMSAEHLRNHCHLRPRTRETGSMLRLRDTTTRAMHDFFQDNGFLHIHTPIMTSSDCEGAGETFQIRPSSNATLQSSNVKPSEYFNHPAYLTVSSQLHLEAVAAAISRVYTLSPCFRAEPSQTSRHLAEFWMLEAEWAFLSSLPHLTSLVEGSIRHILRTHADSPEMDAVWKSHPADVASARRAELHTYATSPTPWTRLTYAEAIDILAAHQTRSGAFVFAPKWGASLQSEHERWLADGYVRGPVFVTDYPAALKPFYMRANAGEPDRETVACFDLLVPGLGELVGGSLREERVGLLEAALDRHGLSREDYGWYLDLRRFGGAPHGGFGLGFERLISWMSGIESVRDCVAMPRWAGRILL